MAVSARVWPILGLILSICISAAAAVSVYGLDAAISASRKIDPGATNDSFASLPKSMKKALAHPSHFNTLERIGHLKSLEILLPVHVRLVGFSGDDPWHLQNQITKYISALHSEDPIHVIGSDTHHLMVKPKLSLDVSPPQFPDLADRLYRSIREQMEASSPVMRSSLHSVPHTAVDEIIHEDMEAYPPGDGAYTIYLLNLKQQDKPYAYSYTRKDSSPAFSNCLGTLWTSGAARYLWVDLGAGPVDYGPALSGEGLLPRGEFHPLAALHAARRTQKSFLADLASLIWSAAGSLLAPPLRIPAFYETDMIVQFIHIHSSDDQGIDRRGLEWSAIEDAFVAEISRGLLLSQQTLRFKRYSVRFSSCPICVAALSRSTRSYTSRFLFENYTLIVSEYLDSKTLHQSLSLAHDEIATLAGIESGHNYVGKILPVYVFDLDYERPLMLDRFHQSIAFRDMVVAVRSRSSQTVSDYNCNGRHVITQARNLERPIVGSILQSMWGVAPTHLNWSPRHNSTLVDYTWSVGQTPFGPFSESKSLSFVQRDAAPRNILLTTLNSTILSALEVLGFVIDHGGEMKLLGYKRHIEFTQRWNLYQYKLDKAVSAISHFDFDAAMYFIKSSDHDLFAIHSLFYKAATELEATLVCFKDPPFPWGSALTLVGIFLVFFYAFRRRDQLFSTKRKQF